MAKPVFLLYRLLCRWCCWVQLLLLFREKKSCPALVFLFIKKKKTRILLLFLVVVRLMLRSDAKLMKTPLESFRETFRFFVSPLWLFIVGNQHFLFLFLLLLVFLLVISTDVYINIIRNSNWNQLYKNIKYLPFWIQIAAILKIPIISICFIYK